LKIGTLKIEKLPSLRYGHNDSIIPSKLLNGYGVTHGKSKSYKRRIVDNKQIEIQLPVIRITSKFVYLDCFVPRNDEVFKNVIARNEAILTN